MILFEHIIEFKQQHFERRTSSGCKSFSLLICLDTSKFSLLSFFTLIKTICPKICSKSRLISGKSPLPFNVHRSERRCLNSLLATSIEHEKLA